MREVLRGAEERKLPEIAAVLAEAAESVARRRGGLGGAARRVLGIDKIVGGAVILLGVYLARRR